MQIKSLCIVLPPNSGEIMQPEKIFQQAFQSAKKQQKTKKSKHPQRSSCGGEILVLLNDSLSKLRSSRRRWRNKKQKVQKEKKSSTVFHDMDGVQVGVKIGRDNPRIFSYAELFIGSNGFSEEQVLGRGGFGKVYKAVLPSDGTVVAVKCCLSEKGKEFEKSFAAELTAVADLRHKNLVRLRGWCVHEDQLHLVYDYMPNRSLDRILFRQPQNSKTEPLSWGQRGKIIKGLAAALYYLHEQLETQIIHRDVKTSNVMLDSHYNAKLGDFGMARWLEHEIEYEYTNKRTSSKIEHFKLGETSKIGGTIGYLPPESLQKPSNSTSKSDVFSFGIVVLEVVSGRKAIDLTFQDDQIILLDWIRRLSDEKKLLEAVDTRLPDGSSSYTLLEMQHFIHVGLLCTLLDPQFRPSMKWVVEALSDLSFKLPKLPSFLSHPLYITLSSPSETSPSSTSGTSSATATENGCEVTNYTSSNYVTAAGETVYVTAENKNSEIVSSKSMNHQPQFHLVETPREISYKEIVSATDSFSDSRRVAELDFGTAYHGILDDNCHVLIKRLGMKTCPALRDRFSNELRNLGRLRHRNLVQLRGWCTEQGEMLVVYDYSASRILSQQLLNKGRTGHSVLQWHHRYNIVKALASAVLYLHEEWDEQVIHRNITSSAVILEQDMNPRLTSFALAEFLSRNEHGHHVVTDTRKSVRGIFGYMSPEYVKSGEATSAADVYSFGVVVLEIVSGQMAVDFRQQEVLLVKKVHEFEMRKRPLKDLADIRLNGEYNDKELMRLVRLGIACTCGNPQLRPSMRQIVSILDGNDKLLNMKNNESREEWRQSNACSLSMIKRIQALGIQ